MQHARTVYQDIFQHQAHTHGAAGWQMNSHAFRLEAEYGFRYASDCRGTQPFLPMIDGRVIACPQLPTTLPTLDEVIGLDGWTEENVHERILTLDVSLLPVLPIMYGEIPSRSGDLALEGSLASFDLALHCIPSGKS